METSVTRSTRIRMRPLQFWNNQRVKYNIHGEVIESSASISLANSQIDYFASRSNKKNNTVTSKEKEISSSKYKKKLSITLPYNFMEKTKKIKEDTSLKQKLEASLKPRTQHKSTSSNTNIAAKHESIYNGNLKIPDKKITIRERTSTSTATTTKTTSSSSTATTTRGDPMLCEILKNSLAINITPKSRTKTTSTSESSEESSEIGDKSLRIDKIEEPSSKRNTRQGTKQSNISLVEKHQKVLAIERGSTENESQPMDVSNIIMPKMLKTKYVTDIKVFSLKTMVEMRNEYGELFYLENGPLDSGSGLCTGFICLKSPTLHWGYFPSAKNIFVMEGNGSIEFTQEKTEKEEEMPLFKGARYEICGGGHVLLKKDENSPHLFLFTSFTHEEYLRRNSTCSGCCGE